MAKVPHLVSREQIDVLAWDTCVAASPQRIIYGYSWYLDAVLPRPRWSWVGIVLLDDAGQYEAVMPIPLRRKGVAGFRYKWVVHQPFFCQFLDIFSRDTALDVRPFFRLLTDAFRYGSSYSTRRSIHGLSGFDTVRQSSTHVLGLGPDYKTVYQQYSRDRKCNLRRAEVANWTLVFSSDPEPLLNLFRRHHAGLMDGGVPEWAYDLLRNLTSALIQRNCGRIQYAVRDGHIEAGVLFAQEGNRIIYLFNAASEAGRKGNARTLLIDRTIQENIDYKRGTIPWLFDFESPEKPSVRQFYQSFGAYEQPIHSVRWHRLNRLEYAVLCIRDCIKGIIKAVFNTRI